MYSEANVASARASAKKFLEAFIYYICKNVKFQGGLSHNLNFAKKRERKSCSNTVAKFQ